MISATKKIVSNNSGIPSPDWADTGTIWMSPPQSSATSSSLAKSPFILSTSASGLSILFIATTICTPAALAWLIASTVWGWTPSSAATTRTTISVEFAPLALIFENAAWPGVSINVRFLSSIDTW